MKRGYGQYCPLSLATELLGQRWTILVISRLIDGCSTFTEIHQGVPRISPTMLTQRLDELNRAGLLDRRPGQGRNTYTYHLTEAGRDLEDVVMKMAVWGQHWARDMSMDDLDPAFLAWSMHTRIDGDAMPPGRTVLEFEFTGAPKGSNRFWIVGSNGEVDMCLKYPGYESDIVVRSNLRRFVETWRGFRDLQNEIDSGQIKLDGPRALVEAFPTWLQLSSLAPYSRKRPGREKRLSQHE